MTRLKFFLIYRGSVLTMLAVYCISDGKDRIKTYVEVDGEVVDLIPVHKSGKYGSYDVMMPQVSYPVGDSNYLFVDHAIYRKPGSRPTVLYSKNNPQDAQIYSIRFWLDLGVIVPTILVSGFIFSIILITITKYKKKTMLLRGHFDSNARPY